MPVYELRKWVDGQGADLAGYYAITDPRTFAEHEALLAPFVTPLRPLQAVLAGDSAQAPVSTVPLHFADMITAQEVLAQVNAPAPVEAPSLPNEVAMYRIRLVMGMTASTHGGTLEDRAGAFIASLPADQKYIANRLWNGPNPAPNLQVDGSFAQGFKAFEGLSGVQWAQLISQAVNMPL